MAEHADTCREEGGVSTCRSDPVGAASSLLLVPISEDTFHQTNPLAPPLALMVQRAAADDGADNAQSRRVAVDVQSMSPKQRGQA